MTILQGLPVTGSVVVTTPQGVATDDTRRAMRMFAEYQTSVLGVVENMSGFVCPDCGGSHDVFGDGGGRELAADVDVPHLGDIPLDPAVRDGGDGGQPVVLTDDVAGEAFRDLTGRVADSVGQLKRWRRAEVDDVASGVGES